MESYDCDVDSLCQPSIDVASEQFTVFGLELALVV
jgi:hypothetical protein